MVTDQDAYTVEDYPCLVDHHHYAHDDYEGDLPRWCVGCGDRAILNAVQNMLAEHQTPPERVVCVSGIGCSSRFPYYMKTYGVHGIHGRALPLSTGISLARPDLKVLTVMGDGDCFSIGAGHWLHALRYNPDLTVLVFDNEVYALTKRQASPTTVAGTQTHTTPHGAFLSPLNPLAVVLSMPQTSFLAQTASWLSVHLSATIEAAWRHRGLSFVRILQRCPVYSPDAFASAKPAGLRGLLSPRTSEKPTPSLLFLEHERGIAVNPALERIVALHGERRTHDPQDRKAAAEITTFGRAAAEPKERLDPIGLIYQNPDAPCYNDVVGRSLSHVSTEDKVQALERELDKFTIETK